MRRKVLCIIGLVLLPFFGQLVIRVSELGFILLVLGIFIPNMKATGRKSAQKQNFRGKDSDENCMNCKYCDMKFFDGLEAGCNWLEIKIDENHVWDLYVKSD